MVTTTPNRRPAGTPAGGQFAPSAHPESGVQLEMFPEDDDQRWAAVGASDPEVRSRLEAAGVEPADFTCDDRDRRMWAASYRGDLIFEGQELLSGAYDLSRHEPSLGPGRFFHHTEKVDIAGEKRYWNHLSAEEQIDYIAGYARGVASSRPGAAFVTPSGDESPAWRAGSHRGLYAAVQADFADRRRLDEAVKVAFSDVPGRVLVVTDVEPDPRYGHGYRAKVAAGQYRYHDHDGGRRPVPYTEGASVHFEADAFGAE